MEPESPYGPYGLRIAAREQLLASKQGQEAAHRPLGRGRQSTSVCPCST